MRIEEIFNNCEFIGSLVGTETVGIKLSVKIPGFDKTTLLYIREIPSQKMNTEIYLRIENSVNNIINLSSEMQTKIWEELWNKYIWVCEESEPFDNLDSEDVKSGNIRYYGIEDLNTLKKLTILTNIDTETYNFNDEVEFANDEIIWNFYFNSEWIGDGFIRVLIDKEHVQDCEIHW
ncbi:MAG: hypothetical protein RLZZ546_2782 [Bacteroidota bacterium]|jgi:hypothetical protein